MKSGAELTETSLSVRGYRSSVFLASVAFQTCVFTVDLINEVSFFYYRDYLVKSYG